MRIKLISPRVTMRPMDSAWKRQMSPPLSLLVLGALTPPDDVVEVADENVERVRFDDEPDLVGITVKVDTVYRAAEIARMYRRRGIRVVMGGIHPTACPDDCRTMADSVVVGEAEHIWPVLVDDARRNRLQPMYRNESPVPIADVPVPRWEILNAGRYLFTNTLRIGRGCPWRCSFCYNSSDNIESRYRIKPLSHILREIESLGTRHIMFIDDNFIGNPREAKRLVQELGRMGVTWHTAVSADIGQRMDLLDAMAESGCRSLFVGFETVNAGSLACCAKVQNRIERYDRTIRAIHDRGMMVNASVAFGFDADNASVFESTLAWLIRNRVETMTAHILTPFPGTQLYQQLLEEGRIIDHDLRRYNTAHAVFRPRLMSPAELEQGYRWIYRRFYSWPSIVARIPESRAQALAYLQFQLIYRKFGKVTSLLGRAFGMRRLAKLARQVAYPERGKGKAERGKAEAGGGSVRECVSVNPMVAPEQCA